MVAHSTFSIPEDVFKFMVVDDWFPLSGQEGHEKEGVLHLILRLLETNYVEFYAYKAVSKGQRSVFLKIIVLNLGIIKGAAIFVASKKHSKNWLAWHFKLTFFANLTTI